MREGEVGQCAYFVVQGRLLVEKEIDGESVPIAEIGPRDMVGEMAILDDAPRSASVIAMEDSILIVLNKHRIRSLIRRSPAVAEVIMKLLCHKLRSRHYSLTQSHQLNDPDIWRKATTILLLCAKGDDNPASLYLQFIQNLEFLLELPPVVIKDIIARLEEASIIETQSQKTLCINEDKLKIFQVLSTEEYANIPIKSFTSAKEYHTAQILLQVFPVEPGGQDIVEIDKNELAKALAGSPLWKELRPHYQEQRSSAILEHLVARKIIAQSPASKDVLQITPSILQQVEVPQEILITYESLKSILIK